MMVANATKWAEAVEPHKRLTKALLANTEQWLRALRPVERLQAQQAMRIPGPPVREPQADLWSAGSRRDESDHDSIV